MIFILDLSYSPTILSALHATAVGCSDVLLTTNDSEWHCGLHDETYNIRMNNFFIDVNNLQNIYVAYHNVHVAFSARFIIALDWALVDLNVLSSDNFSNLETKFTQ